MNRLLVDLGNTSLKWRLQRTDFPDQSGWFDYHDADFSGQLVTDMRDLVKPDVIWIASVASAAANQVLDRFLSDKWQLTGSYLKTGKRALGVTNTYDKPETLGCDRWAAMLAAYHNEKACVLVADCGTALTIDAIDKAGKYLGGAISIGIRSGRSALAQHTMLEAQDQSVNISDRLFARSTAQGIQAGSVYSVVAIIEYAVRQLAGQGHEPVVYVTGGDARYIKNLLAIEFKHEPGLVLDGLALLAEQA